MFGKSLAIGMLLAFVASAIAAESKKIEVEEGITFVVPADSHLGNWKIGEYGVVEFEGRVSVSGKYEYGYATDDPQDKDNYGEKYLSFVLDKQSVASLPYWSRDGQVVNELYLSNPDDFAKAVIPAKQLTNLDARRIRKITGSATIWIENYQVSVECDHQNNYAKFSSVVEKKYVARQEFSDWEGC